MPFTPSGIWTPKQTQAVAQNLNRAYLNAPPQAQQWGEEFYPEWRATAEHIGGATGQGVAGGAAVLAHLSPSNEAEVNRIQALQLTHGGIGSSAQMSAIHKAAASAQAGQSYRASRDAAQRAGDAPAAQRFHEQYQGANAATMAYRRKAGIMGTPLQRVFSTPLSRAVHARQGDYEDPLGSLGEAKLGDFGRMIHDPEHYQRPPIDTHYHDAAVNRTDIPYGGRGSERGLDTASRYEGIQQAHQMAHSLSMEELGEHQPHSAYMGTIWYAQQIRKAIENPGSQRSRKSSATQLANIRTSKRSRQWLPENYGLRPAFARVGA
jgi:hypothetical protein